MPKPPMRPYRIPPEPQRQSSSTVTKSGESQIVQMREWRKRRTVEGVPLGGIDPSGNWNPLSILGEPSCSSCSNCGENTWETSAGRAKETGERCAPASATRLYSLIGIA